MCCRRLRSNNAIYASSARIPAPITDPIPMPTFAPVERLLSAAGGVVVLAAEFGEVEEGVDEGVEDVWWG